MPKLNENIYLVAALRTPIGKFGGALSSLTAPQLGVASAKATIERSGIDPNAIDEVIFGNARQAGVGPNAARQIAVKSGLRHEVPAYTVNQACGSGLRAIMNAADQIDWGMPQWCSREEQSRCPTRRTCSPVRAGASVWATKRSSMGCIATVSCARLRTK